MTEIINKTFEVCNYLSYSIKNHNDPTPENQKKVLAIESHGKEYQKSLFASCYQFLTIDEPSKEDKKQFVNDILKHEKKFREQALDIDRNIWRRLFKVLINLITHITGTAIKPQKIKTDDKVSQNDFTKNQEDIFQRDKLKVHKFPS